MSDRQANAARYRGHNSDQGTRVMKGRVLSVAQIGIHPTLVGTRHARLSPSMIRSNLARSRATAMSCQSSGVVQLYPLPVRGPDQPSRPNPA